MYSDYSLDEQMPLLIFTDNPCIDYFIKLLHRTSMTNVSYSITRRGIIYYNCTDIPFINDICIKYKRFVISFLSQTYLYCFFYLYRCPLHVYFNSLHNSSILIIYTVMIFLNDDCTISERFTTILCH